MTKRQKCEADIFIACIYFHTAVSSAALCLLVSGSYLRSGTASVCQDNTRTTGTVLAELGGSVGSSAEEEPTECLGKFIPQAVLEV